MMYNIMKDAKTVIPDVMGVYSQFLGKKDGVDSGVAIANLVEQGSNNLTEINDNYNFGRMLVGDILLSYLQWLYLELCSHPECRIHNEPCLKLL